MADGHGALKRKPGFATLSIHSGLNPDQWNGAIVPPIVLTAMYKQPSNGNLVRSYIYIYVLVTIKTSYTTKTNSGQGNAHTKSFFME